MKPGEIDRLATALPPDLLNESAPALEGGSLVNEQEIEALAQSMPKLDGPGSDSFKRSLNWALTTSPQAAAEGVRLASAGGLGVDYAAKNAEALRRHAIEAEFNEADFRKEFPHLAKWMADSPANMALALSERDNLGQLERLLGSGWEFPSFNEVVGIMREAQGRYRGWERSLLAALSSDPTNAAKYLSRPGQIALDAVGDVLSGVGPDEPGAIQEASQQVVARSELARIRNKQAWGGGITPEEEQRAQELRAEVNRDVNDGVGMAGRLFTGASDMGTQMAMAVPNALNRAGWGAAIGAGVGSAAGGVGAGPGALAGAGYGLAVGYGEEAIKLESGLMLDELLAAGVDLETARVAAGIYGVLAGSIEVVPAAQAVKHMPGINRMANAMARKTAKDLLVRRTTGSVLAATTKEWAKQPFAEGAEEIAQGITANLTKHGVEAVTGVDLDISWKQPFIEGAQAAYSSILFGFPGAGAFYMDEARRSEISKTQQGRFEQAVMRAARMKMRDESPEKFNEFSQAVAEQGGVGRIFIRQEALRKYAEDQKVDPVELAVQMGADPQAAADAVKYGEDIVVPTGEYLTNVAGTPVHEALGMDIAHAADGMTKREALAADALTEKIAAEMETTDLDAQTTPVQETDESTDREQGKPFEQRFTEAALAGAVVAGIEPRKARMVIARWRATMRILVDRINKGRPDEEKISIEDAFAGYGVTVRDGNLVVTKPGGEALDQSAYANVSRGELEGGRFSTEYVGDGAGGALYGWGLYFGARQQDAALYAEYHGIQAVYEADIPDDDELLNWDGRIGDQSQFVRERIARLPATRVSANSSLVVASASGGTLRETQEKLKSARTSFANMLDQAEYFNYSGRDIYLALERSQDLGAVESELDSSDRTDYRAAMALKSVGVPGNYHIDDYDGESRKNYLIWDDSRIRTVGRVSLEQAPIAPPSKGEPVVFVSPNVREGTDLAYADSAIRTGGAEAFRRMAEEAAAVAGVEGVARKAVGVWADGAEHSVSMTLPKGTSRETANAIGAALALVARQKSALVFHPSKRVLDPKAPSFIVAARVYGRKLADINQDLITAGIYYRTLIPGADENGKEYIEVQLVLDNDKGNADVVQTLTAGWGVVPLLHSGTADYLGDKPGRAESARSYRSTLAESPMGLRLAGWVRDAGPRPGGDYRDAQAEALSQPVSAPGQRVNPGNRHGLWEALRVRVDASRVKQGKKSRLLSDTTTENAAEQLDEVSDILRRHPRPEDSPEAWARMNADALSDDDVPIPPYGLIADLAGDGAFQRLSRLTPGQIADADHGFKNARLFRDLYMSGQATVDTTGRLLLWSILSRGVSPYVQESLFLQAFYDAVPWIDKAARGEFTEADLPEYMAWAKSVAGEGSGLPGAGATHNLGAFGRNLLLNMGKRLPDGRTKLQAFHDLLVARTLTGPQLRREFLKLVDNAGIGNKVVSFTLLVAGYDDVMVIDRVQNSTLFNDGRFGDYNLYDGVFKDGVNKKGKKVRVGVAGSGMASQFDGARGLLVYEAVERALSRKIKEIYLRLGRPHDASIGRYHWESWVAQGAQEASHGTLDLILAEATGKSDPMDGVTAKQGEYGAFTYGARYGIGKDGQGYFAYPDDTGAPYYFSVTDFRELISQIKKAKNGVIPSGFTVSYKTDPASGKQIDRSEPWFLDPRVNRERLGELVRATGRSARAVEGAAQGAATDGTGAGAVRLNQSYSRAGDLRNEISDIRRRLSDLDRQAQSADRLELTAIRAQRADMERRVEDLEREQSRLRQDDDEKPRGTISFVPGAGPQEFVIDLFSGDDPSTILHEGMHFFVEFLFDLERRGLASPDIKADIQTLLDWRGKKSISEWTTEDHEAAAYGWEKYLLEGKSPTAALQAVFERFKLWLIQVYKTVETLDRIAAANAGGEVLLNDNVRRFYDRLVASEDDIAAREAIQFYSSMFDAADKAGVSESDFASYAEKARRAQMEARVEHTRQMMEDVQRETEDWYEEERLKVRSEVEAEVNASPVYRLIAYLSAGTEPDGSPTKLSMRRFIQYADLKKAVGDDLAKRLRNRFPNGVTSKKLEGTDPSEFATLFGFPSVAEMVTAALSAPRREKVIEAKTDQIMTEKYGDFLKDYKARKASAEKAVHGESRAEALAHELRMLAGLANLEGQGSRPTLAAFKMAARERMAKRAVKDIEPQVYARAEATAAKKAWQLGKRGKWAEAHEAKRVQLMNFYLWKEAVKAVEEAEAVRRYAARLNKPAARRRLGMASRSVEGVVKEDFVAALDEVLEKVGLERLSREGMEARQTLAEWVQSQMEEGRVALVAPWLIGQVSQKNWREFTVAELRDVHEALRSIDHNAKQSLTARLGEEEIDFDQMMATLHHSVVSNVKVGDKERMPVGIRNKKRTHRFTRKLRGLDADMTGVEEIALLLDGDDPNGMWAQVFVHAFSKAQAAERDLQIKVAEKLFQAIEALPKAQRVALDREEFYIKSIDQTLTKSELIAVALNIGNESNIDKLMRGWRTAAGNNIPWSEQALKEMLSHLTSEDMDFVQSIWDTLESLWPEIEALERRLTGMPPKRVDAKGFDFKGKHYRGGYYPVVYDYRRSGQGAMAIEQIKGLEFAARAMTPHGHTIERIEKFARPILIDFSVLPRHIIQVVHDVTHREAILLAARVLNDETLWSELNFRLGEEHSQQLKQYLKRMANPYAGMDSTAAQVLDKVRGNFSLAVMGYKASVALNNIANAGPAIAAIGAKWFASGTRDFYANPAAAKAWVDQKSGEMRHRIRTTDLELREQFDRLSGKSGPVADVKRFAFMASAITDASIAYPLFIGAYNKAISEGQTEAQAVAAAESAVRTNLGAGGVKDMKTLQQSQAMRALTMFYSFFLQQYNVQKRIFRTTGNKLMADNMEDKAKAIPYFLAQQFLVTFIPATVAELLSGRWAGKDDEEETWFWWALRKTLTYPFLMFPILREFAGAWDRGGEPRFSPLFSTGEKLYRTVISTPYKVAKGEAEYTKLLADVAEVGGMAMGLPVAQSKVTGGYIYDLATGKEEDFDPRWLLYSRPRGNR